MAIVPNKALPPTTLVDWDRSDNYHNSHLLQKDQTLDFTVQNSEGKRLARNCCQSCPRKILVPVGKVH